MHSSFPTRRWLWLSFRALCLVGWGLVVISFETQAQALRKLEQRAINRTHLTFVDGDTVQRFTVTYAQPEPHFNRFYYWQGPTQILRTAGAYNGRLLTGDYQLTSRNGNLLVSGSFDKGLKSGAWRTWRPDGTPLSSSNWRQGKQRGKTRYYDELGRYVQPVVPPKPAAPVTPTASPRFWQPAYWREIVKRRKLRRAEKRRSKLATPSPVKKIKTKPAEGQPDAPTPEKKVKFRKPKGQLAAPATPASPLPPHSSGS